MIRKLSPAQERYFGKHRKTKKRVVRKHRTLGGVSGRGLKKPVTTFAENGNGKEV